MTTLLFVPLDRCGFHIYASWFDDAELQRRIDRPSEQWFTFVQNEPTCFAWIIYDGAHAIGHVQLDIAANMTGSIAFVVKPELRGCGYGRRIIQALIVRPEVAPLTALEASVEADNLASQRCLTASGFVLQPPELDGDEFLLYTYQKANVVGSA